MAQSFIKTNKFGFKTEDQFRHFLICNYTIMNKSANEIGKEIGTTFGTICNYLKKFGIKTHPFCQKGIKSSHWKGGQILTKDGYARTYSSNHPFKDPSNYVLEHRLVMEKHLGRYLTKDEIVHHVNGIRNDNRIENLELTTKGLHPKCNPIRWIQWVNRYWRN